MTHPANQSVPPESIAILVKQGRRELQKQQVRSRIHSAAIELLAEKGFETTLVEEICERANIARKTFYNYYSSKDELIRSLSQILFYGEMDRMIDLALEQHSSLAERLCYVFRSISNTLSQYEALERTLIQYSLQNINFENNRAGMEMAQMNNAFARLFAEETDSKTKTMPWSKELLTEMAVGMTLAIVLNWVNNPGYDLDGRIEELSQFLLTLP